MFVVYEHVVDLITELIYESLFKILTPKGLYRTSEADTCALCGFYNSKANKSQSLTIAMSVC